MDRIAPPVLTHSHVHCFSALMIRLGVLVYRKKIIYYLNVFGDIERDVDDKRSVFFQQKSFIKVNCCYCI